MQPHYIDAVERIRLAICFVVVPNFVFVRALAIQRRISLCEDLYVCIRASRTLKVVKYAANDCLKIVSVTLYVVRGYCFQRYFIARRIIKLYVSISATRIDIPAFGVADTEMQ